jgi:hypothetical protein
MDRVIEVSFPADGDGFISRRCRACRKDFKVRLSTHPRDELVYCPYCAYRPSEGWQASLTEDQSKYVHALTTYRAFDLAIQLMRNEFQSDDSVILEMPVPHTPPAPPAPVEPDEPMPVFKSGCCRASVKHDGSDDPLHCPRCGRRGRLEKKLTGLDRLRPRTKLRRK